MKMGKGKLISYISVLIIICICSFLIAKYIIRSGIHDDDIPIDTSTRM